MDKHSPPDALMLLSGHCAYCPGVLDGLNRLLKSGALGRLEAVNVEQHPEVAQALGVRGVPWVRIGPFELEGNYSAAELADWADQAGQPDGLQQYFQEQLDSGELNRVTRMIRREPERLATLLQLMTAGYSAFCLRLDWNRRDKAGCSPPPKGNKVQNRWM